MFRFFVLKTSMILAKSVAVVNSTTATLENRVRVGSPPAPRQRAVSKRSKMAKQRVEESDLPSKRYSPQS
jgi:hypothetical protein